jgi:hypothetical protein
MQNIIAEQQIPSPQQLLHMMMYNYAETLVIYKKEKVAHKVISTQWNGMLQYSIKIHQLYNSSTVPVYMRLMSAALASVLYWHHLTV